MANKIKVTQELLARYQNNNCSSQERVLVESWLQDLSFSEQAIPEEKEGDVIWEAIAQKITPPSKSIINFRKYGWLNAAACLLAILSFGLWWGNDTSSDDAGIRIFGSTRNVVDGLEIKPLPNEELFYKAGHEYFNGEIQFCNMFLVKNLQDQPQKIKLKVDCEESLLPNNFVFQPGQSYVVVVANEYNSTDGEQQLYVAPADGLRMLPKGVELRVRKSMKQVTI